MATKRPGSARGTKKPCEAATLQHDEARRKNIPTAEYQSVLQKEGSAGSDTRRLRATQP